MYEKYASKFYDDRHVDLYNLEFIFFVKQRLDKLGHPSLITNWKNNMDKTDYKEQGKKKLTIIKNQTNK